MTRFLCVKGYSGCSVGNCIELDGARVEAGTQRRKLLQKSR